jgi:hypothetical protein
MRASVADEEGRPQVGTCWNVQGVEKDYERDYERP